MTAFTAYSAYRCRHCGVNCINRHDERPTRLGECRHCHRLPDLELDMAAVEADEQEARR